MKLARILPSLVAAACYASPIDVASKDPELLVREGIKLARSQDIQKRIQADFPLDRTWNNEVLFGGSWNSTHPGSAEQADLSVTCLECYTRGTVSAKLVDHDLFKPSLRLGFAGVEAYASLGVAASAGQTFSLNLFASNTPIGIGITGLDVGVVFYVDLVFSLSEALDLSAGFQVTVPDDAYLEADLFGGDINDSSFAGLNSQALPVTVISGHATFKADLRLRVQAGAEASLPFFDIGAGAVVGIYANLIEFVAVVDETPTCPLETEIWWDLNVGAYAHLDVVVDYTTLGPVPTVSTTLLTAPTQSSCHLDAGVTTTSKPSSTGALPATTSTLSNSQPASSSPAETGESSYTSSPITSSSASASLTSISVSVSSSVAISDSSSSSSSSYSYSTGPLPTDSYSSYPYSTYTYSYSVGPDSSSSEYPYPTYSYSTEPYSSSEYPYPTYSYSAEPSSEYPYPTYSSYASEPVYSSAPVSAGPTYTSTYTHTLTRCGCEGVMNCPSDYQTEVVVTRTTTICPATVTATAISTPVYTFVPGGSSYPTGHDQGHQGHGNGYGHGHGQSGGVVVVMTPLPTPVVATFVAPPPPTSTPGHAKDHTAAGHEVATETETETAAAVETGVGESAPSHHPAHVIATEVLSEFPTPSPSPSVPTHGHGHGHGHGNSTVVGTGFVPGPSATQSVMPVTAGAGSLHSVYGVAATLVVALAMGVLVL